MRTPDWRTDALVKRARAHVEGGRPMEGIPLLDIVTSVEPALADALKVKNTALDRLVIASGGGNLS